MKKEWRIALFITITTTFLLIFLIYLATTRQYVPIHIEANISKLNLKIGKPPLDNIKSVAILKNLTIKNIEFVDFDFGEGHQSGDAMSSMGNSIGVSLKVTDDKNTEFKTL